MKKMILKVKNKKRFVTVLSIAIILIVLILLAQNKNTLMHKVLHKILNMGEEEGITVTYADTTRQKFNFNYDWIFSKGEGKNNASSNLREEEILVIPNDSNVLPYQSTYSISENNIGRNNELWEEVSLPHTYNDVDTFDTFTETGYNGDRSTYSGTAWYKKEFYIPLEYQGKEIYIEFEAARQAAKVYLNGTLLEGTYENGFIPFGYNLTQYINYGANNTITVMVDNSYPYYMEGTRDKVSWHDSHWHPNYGGLYRNSYLYVIDPLHLTLPLYSFMQTEGTYIYTSNETSTTADINIEAQVENNYNTDKTVKLVSYVKNMNGTALLEISSSNTTLTAGEKKTIAISDTLTNAIRWSTNYPYLYTVECKLILEENNTETVIDNNSTQIGIRTFRFTNDNGFFLNENYEKLQGWGQKPTNEWAGLGAAYPDWMQDSVIKLMKEAGSNFIRWGHCSGSPTQVSAADKYGLITMQPRSGWRRRNSKWCLYIKYI
ncbi:MAG: beta galactosidase jelly roll domain-containing protein [Clostridia bacterium]|nr:beta galactosidase jelly roll domain-containing protein [Clostridia bacterium]